VIRGVALLADFFISKIYEPVKAIIEGYRPSIEKSSRPEELTKFGTLSEDALAINREIERMTSENPLLAAAWAQIKETVRIAGEKAE